MSMSLLIYRYSISLFLSCHLFVEEENRCLFIYLFTGYCIISVWILLIAFLWSNSTCPGFPGGAVVEKLPANAGDTGLSPGLGRSHMPRSNWAREPQLLSLCVWSLCPATGGAAIVRGPHTAMRSGPRLPQLEKALAQKRRPNTDKNK